MIMLISGDGESLVNKLQQAVVVCKLEASDPSVPGQGRDLRTRRYKSISCCRHSNNTPPPPQSVTVRRWRVMVFRHGYGSLWLRKEIHSV